MSLAKDVTTHALVDLRKMDAELAARCPCAVDALDTRYEAREIGLHESGTALPGWIIVVSKAQRYEIGMAEGLACLTLRLGAVGCVNGARC